MRALDRVLVAVAIVFAFTSLGLEFFAWPFGWPWPISECPLSPYQGQQIEKFDASPEQLRCADAQIGVSLLALLCAILAILAGVLVTLRMSLQRKSRLATTDSTHVLGY